MRVAGRPAIRQIATNRSPVVMPKQLCPEVSDATFQDGRQKLAALRGDDDFLRRVREFLIRVQPEYGQADSVEEQIFDGFPSRADSVLMQQFHNVDWADRWRLLQGFDDLRWKSLGQRVVAEHAPEVLPSDVLVRYNHWLDQQLAKGMEQH